MEAPEKASENREAHRKKQNREAHRKKLRRIPGAAQSKSAC